MDSKLFEGIGQQVAALNCELVDARLTRQGRSITLQIFIDREDGVTIDDCAAVSRQVGVWLDVENPISGSYRLEVSSPGLDRPLKKAADFQKFAGSQVELELHAAEDGQKRWRGVIVGADEHAVTLETAAGLRTFSLTGLHRAKLVPQW